MATWHVQGKFMKWKTHWACIEEANKSGGRMHRREAGKNGEE